MTRAGIYIHWPFCRSKCPYCDFYSSAIQCADEDELIANYCRDLEYYHGLNPDYEIQSIFFGGGTPSLLKPQNIAKLIDHTCKLWPTSPTIEISLEANPNSNYKDMFKDFKSAGINRLSLGVQALNENDLKFLGRTHSLQDALSAIEQVTRTFNNHSIDLIYARPKQKLSAWEKELAQAVNFGLKHISLYQLTIEDGTVFAKKGIHALAENEAASMYTFTQNYLDCHGYPQYEVSNFGLPCIHNLGYWQGLDYIGIGNGAHGRIHINNHIYATTFHRQLEELTTQERAEELIIMGLRIFEGINKQRFALCCGLDFNSFVNAEALADLCRHKLLVNTATTVRPTAKGLLVLNQIITELCSD